MFAAPEVAVLPLGLPDLPFHLRLDALSAFFLLLLGAASAGVSVFAAGYFRSGEGTPPGLLCLQYHVFLASMALVLLADDAYAFMVAWETMALSSFFLVTTDHRIAEIRRAGFLYLLIAHVGAIAHPAVLRRAAGRQRRLHVRRHARAAAARRSGRSVAFLLALFGFGAKAGLLPLHVWLPEAHPGRAVAGVGADERRDAEDRDLRPAARHVRPAARAARGGGACVAARARPATALFGVIFAAVQTDMKRLLAYSSIENIGIIVAGIGLAILFSRLRHDSRSRRSR